MLRAMADAENTRRRAERDKIDASQYAVTRFARDVLSVADNLKRALEHYPAEARAAATPQVKAVIEGVEATERHLLATLERHGVKPIDTSSEGASIPTCTRRLHRCPAKRPAGRLDRECGRTGLCDRRPLAAPFDGDRCPRRCVVASSDTRAGFGARQLDRYQGEFDPIYRLGHQGMIQRGSKSVLHFGTMSSTTAATRPPAERASFEQWLYQKSPVGTAATSAILFVVVAGSYVLLARIVHVPLFDNSAHMFHVASYAWAAFVMSLLLVTVLGHATLHANQGNGRRSRVSGDRSWYDDRDLDSAARAARLFGCCWQILWAAGASRASRSPI